MNRVWMAVQCAVVAAAILFSSASNHAQTSVTGACAEFGADGALATGTRRGGDLEITLDERGALATTHAAIAEHQIGGLTRGCEQAFSDDGKWLATLVAADDLTVVIVDRQTKTLHRAFTSQWYDLRGMPIELLHQSLQLGGFQPDDSLVLWRYVPRAVAERTDASRADLHMQRWSIDGELLSDQDLGSDFHVRSPLAGSSVGTVWVPAECPAAFEWCYRGVMASAAQATDAGIVTLPRESSDRPVLVRRGTVFSVLGTGMAQKAVLLDASGSVDAQVNLPRGIRALWPISQDWFEAGLLRVSTDREVAAIGRKHVAWFLTDTSHDEGSEIALLRIKPLAVMTTVKAGKGGILALAVDHRNGIVRAVGFWSGAWHDLRCDESHPEKCGQ